MSAPLVSVMMPCFNARQTLPWALASLMVQTCADWELVFVDDGSTDGSHEIVEAVGDPRFRVVRLPANMGRGHARQIAIDMSRGDFVCMLDADDWMYPTRIEQEVRVLQIDSSLTLVSAGMAIVDGDNELTGIRGNGTGERLGPHRGIGYPVAHAASMYRRDHLQGVHFDPSPDVVEDLDFILRLMQGRYFTVLPRVLYVYAELASVSARSAGTAQHAVRRTLWKHRRSYPGGVLKSSIASLAKEAIYRAAGPFGGGDAIIRRRSRRPRADELTEFKEARAIVARTVAASFGDPSGANLA